MRSRFHIAAMLGGAAVLGACGGHFGPGLSGLAATQGWQPLPIEAWVLNEGFAPKSMVFCPRETCTQQAFAALISLDGAQADRLEQALRADPARLAREFARPAASKPGAKPAKPTPAKSMTTVTRFQAEGQSALLVEIIANATGKRAATAIIHGRGADGLVIALAVGEDAQAARDHARAVWRSR